MTKEQKSNLIRYFAIALSDAYTYGTAQCNLEHDTVVVDRVRQKSKEDFIEYLNSIDVADDVSDTNLQKDRLLYYIGCLNGSAFNHGIQRGVEIFSQNERNISPVNYDERHNRDLDQLLIFVNSIYPGENNDERTKE